MNSVRTFAGGIRMSHILKFLAGIFLAVAVSSFVLPVQALAEEDRYDINLSLRNGKADYYALDNLKPGEENKLYLELNNYGNKPITNIRLSAEAPEGWVVVIQPDKVAQLDVGRPTTVDVIVIPTGNATREGREVALIVESNEISRHVQTFWLNVSPAQQWLWLWGGLVLAIILVFVFVFMRFNKGQ